MADGFGAFTAGRIGEKATEERRFQQGIGIQQQQLGLQSRGLDIQEAGQEAQLGVQQTQETRLREKQDLETEEGRRKAALERFTMLADLEASRRLLLENDQEDPGIGSFLETQGGVEQTLKLAGLNKDHLELSVLRSMERQRTEQRDSSQQVLGSGERIIEQGPGGVEEVVPPVDKPPPPPTESGIMAGIFQNLLSSPNGVEDLPPQEQQILAFKLSQNPLSQFALSKGVSLSEMLGGSFFEEGKFNPAEQSIITRSIKGIKDGVNTPQGIIDQLEANESMSDERRREIALAIGLGDLLNE